MALGGAVGTTVTVLLAQGLTDLGALGGAAGWAGAGLLGLVLYWVLMIHLPAKDKQLKELVDAQITERDKERDMRHDLANTFQTALSKMTIEHARQMNQAYQEHTKEAALDREAFLKRNDRLEDAIKSLQGVTKEQTVELKKAILGGEEKS